MEDNECNIRPISLDEFNQIRENLRTGKSQIVFADVTTDEDRERITAALIGGEEIPVAPFTRGENV